MNLNSILGGSDVNNDIIENEVKSDSGNEKGAANSGNEKGAANTPGTNVDYSKILGENGCLADNWRDALPEDIRNEKSLDSIKTLGTLAKSYVFAQKAIGSNKIVVPSEKSSDEEWADFFKASGRPDSSDLYSTDKIDVPDGISLDDEKIKSFKEFAFSTGLSQKAFEAVVNYDIKRTKEMIDIDTKSREAEYALTMDRLRQDFGSELPGVIAQCNKALSTFGLVDVFRNAGLLNNYDAIKALANVGSKISESRLADFGNKTDSKTIDEKISEIVNNPDDPYYKSDHPSHTARVDEVCRMLRAKSGMN